MRFKCQTSVLNERLAVAARAISSKSPMAILEGVLIEAGDGEVILTCTDSAYGIETRFDAEVDEPGRIVLPGRLLTEVVRKLPDGEVSVSVEWLVATIRCLGSRTKITGQPGDEFPQLQDVSGDTAVISQKSLKDMIRQTSFSIATDDSRPILTGCLLESEGPRLTIVALDGFRLSLRRDTAVSGSANFYAIIPGKALTELGRTLSDSGEAGLTLSPTHMMVEMDGTRIITRLMEGEYVNYKAILPNAHKTLVRADKALLEACIDRASLMAREGKNNLVKFHISDDMMIITSNAEMGDVYEELPVEVEGTELEIAFNVRYFTDALKVIEDEKVTMRFDQAISPCVLMPEEGDSFFYLVLPVRMFQGV